MTLLCRKMKHYAKFCIGTFCFETSVFSLISLFWAWGTTTTHKLNVTISLLFFNKEIFVKIATLTDPKSFELSYENFFVCCATCFNFCNTSLQNAQSIVGYAYPPQLASASNWTLSTYMLGRMLSPWTALTELYYHIVVPFT